MNAVLGIMVLLGPIIGAAVLIYWTDIRPRINRLPAEKTQMCMGARQADLTRCLMQIQAEETMTRCLILQEMDRAERLRRENASGSERFPETG